jgi:putative tryptophan/tyrosine transport system substrate-binding protein
MTCSAHRVAIAALLLMAGAHAGATRLVVVQGSDAPHLARTLEAIRSSTTMPVEVIRLSHDRDVLQVSLTTVERDRVIVALGVRASDLLMSQTGAGPVVHCLAGPDAMRAGLPAVPSEPPTDQQAQWLRKVMPQARNVAVLFDPAVNARRAEAIAASLDIAGYKVLLQPVGAPAELPQALAALAGRADVMLAVPDRTVYAPEALNGILLFSFRNRIPLVGPNDAWVKKGALFAIGWDYAEVGASCVALALREAQAAKSSPVTPPRPRVWLNTKLAPRFGLTWDDALLRSPGVRYE